MRRVDRQESPICLGVGMFLADVVAAAVSNGVFAKGVRSKRTSNIGILNKARVQHQRLQDLLDPRAIASNAIAKDNQH